MKIRYRYLSLKEIWHNMFTRQRLFTVVEDVYVDEAIPYGKNNLGQYFRVEGDSFTPMDARDVAIEYLRSGLRIPDDFIEVRNVVQSIFN